MEGVFGYSANQFHRRPSERRLRRDCTGRQLVAISPGSARTVRQGFQTAFFVAVKDLVAGLA